MKILTKWLIALSLCSYALMGPATFAAATHTETLHVVGVSDDYPIMFINRNGLPDGLAVDLLRSFSESYGYKLHFELLPPDPSRLIYDHQADLYYDAGFSESPSNMRATVPFYIKNYKLFTQKRLISHLDLPGMLQNETSYLKVGYRQSPSLRQFLNRIGNHNLLVGSVNYDASIDALEAGQLDVILLPSEIGNLLLSERQITSLEALETTLYLEENGFSLAPEHILLQFELNSHIQTLIKSGDLQTLIHKWINLPVERSQRSETLSLINYFFLISAFATFVFSYRSYHLERNVEKQANELHQLNRANEALWTALINEERYKNEYYLSLSHELKTPVSLILNAVNAVERSAASKGRELQDERLLKYTGIAKSNSLRLLRVINNLIDANHIENKDYSLDLKPVELVGEMRELIRLIHETLEPSALAIDFSSKDNAIHTVVDPYELDRVLLNLISNAIKFNEHRPEVTIQLQVTEDQIQIDFEDNSTGIPKTLVQKAFLKYHQLETTFSKKAEGAGFGLYLAHQLTTLHHGSLNPLYSSQQEGMHYRLVLPLKPNDDPSKLSSGKSLFYDRSRLVRLELSEIKSPSN